MIPSTSLVAVAAAVGLVTQLVLSSINEVDTLKFIGSAFVSEVLVLAILLKNVYTASVGLSVAAVTFLQLNASFFTTLIVATVIRRLFFHPLRKFPGRKLAAVSKIYECFLNSQGTNALKVREWHNELGDFVRTAPNEISINNVEALQLYQRQTYDSRGPLYEFAKVVGDYNLLTARQNATHRKWRAIWDQGFKTSAVKTYNPRVEHHVGAFIKILDQTAGKPVNCVPLLANLAFDVMADLGFGKDYGMQTGTGDPTYLGTLHSFMRVLSIAGTFRNLMDIFPYIPVDKQAKDFRAKGAKMVNDRTKLGKSREDIFSHLLGEDSETGTKFTPQQLRANALLLIVAGSDTTSTVLSNLFRELALRPDLQQRVYDEVHEAAQAAGPDRLNCENTKGLPYLQAVIDETLRLWNPVPSGPQTQTGPEGATIAGRFIPPNTTVRVHNLTLMTDERYFPQGEKFLPERWLGDKEGVKDIRAFVPFSLGPHSCVGKQLALNELRLTVAKTIDRFVIELDESYSEEKYRSEWRDYFTVMIGTIEMRFLPRK